MDNAKYALNVRMGQMAMIDAAIERRGRRAENLQGLHSRGQVGEPVYDSAQAEYLETMSRKQEVVVGIQQIQAQVSDAEANLARLKLDARFALQHEISDLEQQIAQQAVVYRSHLAVASIINADPNTPGATPLTFDLIRRTGGQVATYRVNGGCLLQPGDLVRVFLEGGPALADTASNAAVRKHPGNGDGKVDEHVDAGRADASDRRTAAGALTPGKAADAR
jgi:hypothetical protein